MPAKVSGSRVDKGDMSKHGMGDTSGGKYEMGGMKTGGSGSLTGGKTSGVRQQAAHTQLGGKKK